MQSITYLVFSNDQLSNQILVFFHSVSNWPIIDFPRPIQSGIANCSECPLIRLTEGEEGEQAVSVLNVMAGGDLTGMIFYRYGLTSRMERKRWNFAPTDRIVTEISL